MIEQLLQADRYLQVDQVARARDLYARVADTDPGNAIAVVGLARCALAEGDEREAYRLASRALQIDPEDDMARRMEARLSEVLAGRGEPVERPAAAATASPRAMRPVVTAAGTGETAPSGTSIGADTTSPAVSGSRKSLIDRLLGR